MEHRIGGLEKEHETGNVSYDPDNHEFMCKIRQDKIDRIADFIPELEVDGEESGDLLVLSWGGTYGACTTAVTQCQAEGLSVSHAHLRFINPFPRNLETLLGNFKKVVIPELNLGQLQKIVSSTYGVQTEGIHKLKGRPFTVSELKEQFKELIG